MAYHDLISYVMPRLTSIDMSTIVCFQVFGHDYVAYSHSRKSQELGLVSLFNGILTFVGYLIQNPFFENSDTI